MATISFTFSADHAQRMGVAYGAHLGLGRDATAAEVRQAIIDEIIQTVKYQEEIPAVEAARDGVPPIISTT